MKFAKGILALALVLGVAGLAEAGPKKTEAGAAAAAADKPKAAADKPKAAKGVKGKVVKVDGTNLVIAVGKDGTEKTIATDDKTKVTIEGKEATLADLKAGLMVAISPAEGTAATIEVAAPKPKKDKAAADAK